MNNYAEIRNALSLTKSENREEKLQEYYSDLAGARKKVEEDAQVRAEVGLPVSFELVQLAFKEKGGRGNALLKFGKAFIKDKRDVVKDVINVATKKKTLFDVDERDSIFGGRDSEIASRLDKGLTRVLETADSYNPTEKAFNEAVTSTLSRVKGVLPDLPDLPAGNFLKNEVGKPTSVWKLIDTNPTMSLNAEGNKDLLVSPTSALGYKESNVYQSKAPPEFDDDFFDEFAGPTQRDTNFSDYESLVSLGQDFESVGPEEDAADIAQRLTSGAIRSAIGTVSGRDAAASMAQSLTSGAISSAIGNVKTGVYNAASSAADSAEAARNAASAAADGVSSFIKDDSVVGKVVDNVLDNIDDPFKLLKGLTSTLLGVDLADQEIPGIDLVTDTATLVAGLATGLASVFHSDDQPQLQHRFPSPMAETVAPTL
tara:strand:- start:9150 stop:10433 length:1284 start_codon:yes stop_codon:yes gene_type:complete